jgi:hypothetical protein
VATEHFEPLSDLDPFATKLEAVQAMREGLGGNLKHITSKPKSRIGNTGHTWMYHYNFRNEDGNGCCNLGFSVWVGVGTDDELNPDKKRSCHSNHSRMVSKKPVSIMPSRLWPM